MSGWHSREKQIAEGKSSGGNEAEHQTHLPTHMCSMSLPYKCRHAAMTRAFA